MTAREGKGGMKWGRQVEKESRQGRDTLSIRFQAELRRNKTVSLSQRSLTLFYVASLITSLRNAKRVNST